mgnify:CR=1 FL=1
MTKYTSLLIPALLASVAATPAFAQSSDEEHWEGGYIGGSFGLGAQNNDRDENVQFDANLDGNFDDTVNTVTGANAFAPGFCGGGANSALPTDGCRSDRDGLEYFIKAGYDTQYGNLVIGALVEGGRSESVDRVTAFSSTPAFYTFERKMDYSVGARGRIGVAAKGALFYGTGGVTYGRIKNRFTTNNGVNSFSDNGKTWSWGYTVGGGAEIKVAENLSMGLEYLHSNFVDDDFVVAVGPGTAGLTNPFRRANPNGTNLRRGDSDFETHNIRLTASIRF